MKPKISHLGAYTEDPASLPRPYLSKVFKHTLQSMSIHCGKHLDTYLKGQTAELMS